MAMCERAGVKLEEYGGPENGYPASESRLVVTPSGDHPHIEFIFNNGLLINVYCAI